ncbi:MAG: pyruvate, water dikinase [Baekduia sp.]|jgi:pyruvate,water dikinase|nr:pyruvate, water dikinase [Baekduia sp.]
MTQIDDPQVPAEAAGSFPSPFAITAPEGAEGWERLYPYYALFSEDRRAFEESKLWFHDAMHYPEPVYPFDLLMPEDTWVILNQNTTKVFRVPSSLGLDHRVVNGYIYVSPTVITDDAEIQRRAKDFQERAGHYFAHWDELYDNWVRKAEDCRARLKAITFDPLPAVEPLEVVTEGRERTSGYRLMEAYETLLANVHEEAYLHFEMLGLGYGAFLTFRDFCATAFPGIRDQTVASMVSGIDILLFRPDEELRKLAHLAVELDVDGALQQGDDPDAALAAVGAVDGGTQWLAALEDAREPWFWYSTGSGLSHNHPSWNDDLTFPLDILRGYVTKLRAGETIERPLEEVESERERITAEYRELLSSDDDREGFDQLVKLARTVYPFVENHNFYVEHQHYSLFWNKVRDLGQVFAHHGYLADAEDIFLLHRYEIYPAIWDLTTGWATETPDRRAHWQREVAERARIMDVLRGWSPPPALGPAPEEVTEAFTVMLWGITTDTLDRWRRAQDGGGPVNELEGVAASPGVAEGPARVITSPSQLTEVLAGEVLVCPITAPSWAPIFNKIAAAVSDIGGIMSHAAIVSREYGLPAVVGTGFGTKTIKTGQIVRVDGSKGTVTIIE